jgi:hypothetical protein
LHAGDAAADNQYGTHYILCHRIAPLLMDLCPTDSFDRSSTLALLSFRASMNQKIYLMESGKLVNQIRWF